MGFPVEGKAIDPTSVVANSLAYRVAEIERHFHSYESWFGQATVPSGETHVADRIGSDNGAFQVDADNDDWGSWVQILGSSDTPARGSNLKFDLHRLLVTAAEHNEPYFVQVAFGDSGAAALAAGEYTESAFMPVGNKADPGPMDVQDRRKDTGTKAWARCMCPGQNTGTLDFFVGLHEYEF